MSRKRFYLLVRCLCAMLCCITFLLTSFTTKASETNTPYNQTETFSTSFDVTIYPSSSTVTGSNVGLNETGGTATYNISLSNVYPNYNGTITHGSTSDTVRISTTTGTNSTSGTATPNTSSTSGTITGTIGAAGGYSYFDTDLEFELLPLLFETANFNSNYAYVSFVGWGDSYSIDKGSLVNSRITFADGTPLTTYHYFAKGPIRYSSYLKPPLFLKTHLSYSSSSSMSNPVTFRITLSFRLSCSDVSSSVVAQYSTPTQDIQGNNLQQQNNNITQDTNTITHDTNNKITSFFNSFFDNLIHIFVPEDGFFSQWFSSLNDFMAQKLGFLWSPFDFMISFLNGVYSGSGSASLVFPELAWTDGTVIIPRTEFSFDNIAGQSFIELRDMIYFATDVILLGAVVSQFYKKIKLVFEGGGD